MKHSLTTVIAWGAVVLSSVTSSDCVSIKEYIPFLKPKYQQETNTKEYAINPECIITIKGSCVAVECATWNEKKVAVVTTKQVPEKGSLSDITITDFLTPHSLTLTAESQESQAKVTVALTIPEQASLTICTTTGDVVIKGPVAGKIHTTTDHGNILIENPKSHIVASCNQTGSITIVHPSAPLKAVTNKGNITITQAHESIFAQANSGSIRVSSQVVPPTATVRVHSQNGLIALELPKEVNADLQASAKKGTITCQHPVTLKPKTTILDAKAWKSFKENVDGILGSGDATIVLQAERGSIKIIEGHRA